MKSTSKGLLIYLAVLLTALVVVLMVSSKKRFEDTSYTNEELAQDLKEDSVLEIYLIQNEEVPTGTVHMYFSNGQQKIFYTPDVSDTIETVQKYGDSSVRFDLSDVDRPSIWEKLLPYVVVGVILSAVLVIFMSRSAAGGGNAKILNFTKSRARKDLETTIRFDDVAGLTEEKEELSGVVDFLKDPGKYTEMGARIPKGVILVGPPGTGKTLLAKAVSGEAGVPFFSISGSDFVEMFVGVGAARVRDLFEDAKKNAPCIVFIDEIDAVARRRGSGLGGGHDEKEQTLNQLLVEMDGFNVNEGIIVMAATNRVDILDPAILRAGRFDRKVAVGKPDVAGREAILKVHAKDKKIGEDVSFLDIARTTAGFSGADLENLLNEAAIAAAKDDRKFINKADIDRAFIKVGIGTEKKSRKVTEKERKITAYHESGHAILFHELELMDNVYTVSIIPTGIGAAGYTMPIPENDNEFMSKRSMEEQIMVDFGGRIAEELIFEDVTTGASQDIKQATEMARSMVTKYGFSEKVGPLNYEINSDEEVFLGRDLGHARTFGENVATTIDEEVKAIIDRCYAEAKEIIIKNMDVLHASAELLLEKERITGEEFDALFDAAKA